MLTKSDFVLFLDSPLHLWAKTHDRLDNVSLSEYDKHLMEQGYEVEKVARTYIDSVVFPQYEMAKLMWQTDFVDGEYFARGDAVIYDVNENVIDIYEIKSSTNIDKQQLYDASFQTLVCQSQYEVRNVYLLHLQKQYARDGEIKLRQLFVAENITEKVHELLAEVGILREQALRVVKATDSRGIEGCLKPKDCPSLSFCHKDLPKQHIFLIPRINGVKSRELKDDGVTAIADIPDDFPLSSLQRNHVTAVKMGKPVIKMKSIAKRLEELTFPLHFLDYETYNTAIPMFDGYHPQQCMTFQYSLHVFESADSEPKHFEYLCTDRDDPAAGLLHHLREDMNDQGSVVVWNKGFEGGRNKEMAVLYPEYGEFLNGVNSRMFDLMEIFSKGLYVHPDFLGSASIKNVLPVLVPTLTYKGLPVGKGDEAMVAWWKIIHNPENNQQLIKDLLGYCELDTLAMVEIWKVLRQL